MKLKKEIKDSSEEFIPPDLQSSHIKRRLTSVV